MRCFLAWNPDDRARRELLALIATLARERQDPGYRWTLEDQAHLTLRFLGESTNAQLEALMPDVAALATTTAPIDAWTAGWQFWPSRERPSVLVLRIEPQPRLAELADKLEAVAQSVGFAAEKRPFKAHLTLARIGRLRDRAAPLDAPPPRIDLSVDHIALVQSRLGSAGSRYTTLAQTPLQA